MCPTHWPQRTASQARMHPSLFLKMIGLLFWRSWTIHHPAYLPGEFVLCQALKFNSGSEIKTKRNQTYMTQEVAEPNSLIPRLTILLTLSLL